MTNLDTSQVTSKENESNFGMLVRQKINDDVKENKTQDSSLGDAKNVKDSSFEEKHY